MIKRRSYYRVMKLRKTYFLLVGLLVAVALGSCGGHSGQEDPDVNLLYGKWQEGTVFERYYAEPIDYVLNNGDTVKVNGTTWDEGDDISEDEAQAFNWTLTGTTLKIEHVGVFITVPQVFTISKLSNDELVYYDAFDETHVYSKVN